MNHSDLDVVTPVGQEEAGRSHDSPQEGCDEGNTASATPARVESRAAISLEYGHIFPFIQPQTIVCNITMENCFFLVLVSNSFATGKQLSDQSRAVSMLKTLHFPFDVLDGSDLANKEVRNGLFEVSGVRAKYPQFFLVDNRGMPTYVGDFDMIEQINEASSLPEEVLEQHPSTLTWAKLLNGQPTRSS